MLSVGQYEDLLKGEVLFPKNSLFLKKFQYIPILVFHGYSDKNFRSKMI